MNRLMTTRKRKTPGTRVGVSHTNFISQPGPPTNRLPKSQQKSHNSLRGDIAPWPCAADQRAEPTLTLRRHSPHPICRTTFLAH
jgi:hypothetical protein